VDLADELFDVCDDTGRLLGHARPRALVHRDGDWHRSFHCWVVHGGPPSDPWLLLQRRSATKDTWPGLWDVSVTGHYSAGEGIEGGLREIREELGLDVALDDLIQVGWRREEVHHENGLIDREIQDIAFLERELDLRTLRPEPSEVTGVVSIPAMLLEQLSSDRVLEVPTHGVRVEPDGTLSRHTFLLNLASLIPRNAGYYQRAARFAQRLRAGSPDTAIRTQWP
jgi:isopentenyldiphosphate isomerase